MDGMYHLSHPPPVTASATDQPVTWMLVVIHLPGQPFPLLQHPQLLTQGQAPVTERVTAALKTAGL